MKPGLSSRSRTRIAVMVVHEGYISGEVARKIEKGIVAKTVENRPSTLRAMYGPEIVPYRRSSSRKSGWYPIESDAELLVVSGAFIVAAESESGDLLDGGGSGSGGSSRYLWPSTAEEFDAFVGVTGTRIPDSPTTPGRSKVQWKLADDLAVTYEQHPYDLGGPLSHTGPHWHMSYSGHSHTPGALPGTPIPGKWTVR